MRSGAKRGATTMPIGEFCNRQVVIASAAMTTMEAARLMREHHVGSIVVVEERDGRRSPAGIVTDRDIVIEVLAAGLDPDAVRVGEIMADGLLLARDADGVFETLQRMREKGVRRVPVVDRSGVLVGLVALDDLVALLAEEMGELARLVANEQVRESRLRR